MEKPIYFVQDKFVEKKNAFIHVNDIGLLRGFAVFDYFKTYFGEPFHLTDHIQRLFRSADLVGLKIHHSQNEISKIVYKLIEKNNFSESSIRIVVTGGVGTDSRSPGIPTLIIYCDPRNELDNKFYTTGVKIKSVQDIRDIPLAKTINYTHAIKYLSEFIPKGFFEVLYVFNDLILECTSSNIFIIKNNRLITPKGNLLSGITRNLILSICSPEFEAEEREVTFTEVLAADESFITSTDKEVLPVVAIDDNQIGNGKIGTGTELIMKKFRSYVDSKVWSKST
ncbi:MAG: aminotransferase class IV [Bacteroidetes bacterium]|nr:aminotransferase class IV [Bacteroidota bacterium]